jgi:two-component sensor histidine kinase
MHIDLPAPTSSDTLYFGVERRRQSRAEAPAEGFPELLRLSCLRAIEALRRERLIIHLEVQVDGICPEEHRIQVLLAAAEMTCNAIQHGLYERSFGRIAVHLTAGGSGGTLLQVSDNGWGFGSSFCVGRGWRLLRSLGRVSIQDTDQGFGTLVNLQFEKLS